MSRSKKSFIKREIIRTRMTLAILLLVLIFFNLTAWLIYYHSKKNYQAEAGRSLVSFTKIVSSIIKPYALRYLTPGDEETYLYREMKESLRELTENGDVDSIYIFDHQGRTLVDLDDSVRIGSKSTKIHLTPKELEQVRTGESKLSKPFIGKGGKVSYSAYTPVPDSEGMLVGILGADSSFPLNEQIAQFRQRLSIIGVISLVFAVGLSIILTGPLVRPIGILSRSLIEQMNYNEYILRSMSSGVITVDLQGKVTTLNRVAKEILELSEVEITGREIESVLKNQEELLTALKASMEKGITFSHSELNTMTSRGREVVLGLSISLLKNNEEKIIGTSAFFSDLTATKELQRRVHLKERLAALGELSAGVAHEIRNPLEGIQVFTGLLRKRLGPTSEEMTLLNNISGEIRSLNAIVTEFLDFARPTKLNMEHTSVTDIVENALLLLSPKLNRSRVKVIRHWETDKRYTANLDRERLKEAFLNIIANAAEAMEKKGGMLDIFIRELGRENGHSGGSEIQIEFSNNGPFIPQGDIDKIFNPFYTMKEKGTGLGLAMVHKIVEGHCGTINVVSNEAEGTRFTIRLPVNDIVGV